VSEEVNYKFTNGWNGYAIRFNRVEFMNAPKLNPLKPDCNYGHSSHISVNNSK